MLQQPAQISPEQIALVKGSLITLIAEKDRLADLYYSRLATLDQGMIQAPKNIVAQRARLISLLSRIVLDLHDPVRLRQIADRIGHRYHISHVTDLKLTKAMSAFVWAVELILHDDGNERVREAWLAASAYFQGLIGEAGNPRRNSP